MLLRPYWGYYVIRPLITLIMSHNHRIKSSIHPSLWVIWLYILPACFSIVRSCLCITTLPPSYAFIKSLPPLLALSIYRYRSRRQLTIMSPSAPHSLVNFVCQKKKKKKKKNRVIRVIRVIRKTQAAPRLDVRSLNTGLNTNMGLYVHPLSSN